MKHSVNYLILLRYKFDEVVCTTLLYIIRIGVRVRVSGLAMKKLKILN